MDEFLKYFFQNIAQSLMKKKKLGLLGINYQNMDDSFDARIL